MIRIWGRLSSINVRKVRYLCARHRAERWYPSDLARRFDADRLMDWQQTTINPAGRDAFIQLVRTPGPERSEERVARSVSTTETLWNLLDLQLATQLFRGGDRVGMADLVIACERHRWVGLPADASPQRPHPHLDGWYRHIHSQPESAGVLDLPLS